MAKRNKRRSKKVTVAKVVVPTPAMTVVESVYVPKQDNFAKVIDILGGYIDAFVGLFYKVA
jgi:hypothetical protein